MKVALEDSINDLFKEVDKDQWTLFMEVQKLLLKGVPLEVEDLIDIFNATEEIVIDLIEQFGDRDPDGKVVAFAGLSVKPTSHSFKVNNQQLYTWCAADAIIFPSMLNVLADIKSKDPVSGLIISLTVDRKNIMNLKPETAYISWVEDRDINNIRASMCNRVHFFESKQTAESWLRQNVDASVFPVKNILNRVDTQTCC